MSEARYRSLLDDAQDGVVARVRAAQADDDAGRFTRHTNVASVMAAIDAAEDDELR